MSWSQSRYEAPIDFPAVLVIMFVFIIVAVTADGRTKARTIGTARGWWRSWEPTSIDSPAIFVVVFVLITVAMPTDG